MDHPTRTNPPHAFPNARLAIALAAIAAVAALAPVCVAQSCPNVPAATVVEPEPCGSDLNGGCATGTGFTAIALGDVVAGTMFAGGGLGDRDMYTFTLTEPMRVTVRVFSDDAVRVALADDSEFCFEATWATATAQSAPCESTVTACLAAGRHEIQLRFLNLSTSIPCGSSRSAYRLQLTGTPADCAPFEGACAGSGAEVVASTPTWAPFGNMVVCVDAGGNSLGGFYFKWFSGLDRGTLECIDVPMRNSGLPANVLLKLVRDTTGGPPDGTGTGSDLVPIAEKEVVVPTCTYATIRWTLDAPVCLDGFAGDLMLIAYCPSHPTGGQLAAAGNSPTTETTPTWFTPLGCAPGVATDAAGRVPGPPYAWPVRLRGSFSAPCAEPCPADLNGSGVVDGADLSLVLSAWGSSPSIADLDHDGDVDGADLSLLLGAWGACG